MNQINLEQGSDDWLMYRRGGIGSSDAPAVMGCSPYLSAYELWKEKLGLGEPRENNYILEKGKRLEPAARAAYEILHDYDMPAMNVEHKAYPFLRASLDGCNLERKLILEIKYVGAKMYQAALDGEVPPHHYCQLQHQMLVTGLERAHYFAWNEGQGALIEIQADFDYMRELLAAHLDFWSHVISKTPPTLTELDEKHARRKKK